MTRTPGDKAWCSLVGADLPIEVVIVTSKEDSDGETLYGCVTRALVEQGKKITIPGVADKPCILFGLWLRRTGLRQLSEMPGDTVLFPKDVPFRAFKKAALEVFGSEVPFEGASEMDSAQMDSRISAMERSGVAMKQEMSKQGATLSRIEVSLGTLGAPTTKPKVITYKSAAMATHPLLSGLKSQKNCSAPQHRRRKRRAS